jgi:predicted lipoprotein
LLLACGNTGAPEVDYGPLLQNLSEQVILPEHQAFAAQADALVVAVQGLSDAADVDSLLSAQNAWRDARRAYRTLDALHFGPDLTLRITERIDVSPVDAPGIESLALGAGAVDDAAIGAAGGQKKGFLGLEYLLFPAPSTEDPAPTLVDDAAAARRRALALGMAHEIARSAHQLDDAWAADKGGYVEQLELAGKGGTQYATQRAAVDDIVGGASYALELIVGIRLAIPLGRKPGADPTARSDNAVPDMQASLSGVLALYQGDGLAAVIAPKSAKLDELVLAEFSAGKAKLAAIPAPFAAAVTGDTPLVQAAYDATRALKATWNTDLASALGATVKVGDNDGD